MIDVALLKLTGLSEDPEAQREARAFMEWCNKPENRDLVRAAADRMMQDRPPLPTENGEPPDCECNFEACAGEHVYFVRCQGYVKIGYAVRPSLRLAMLRTGNPFPIVPELLFPGTRSHEAEWHHRFAAHRERGEWFRIEGKLEQFLASDEASGLFWEQP